MLFNEQFNQVNEAKAKINEAMNNVADFLTEQFNELGDNGYFVRPNATTDTFVIGIYWDEANECFIIQTNND